METKESSGDVPVYNILLLGESGVGKSMFVNSFVNYAQYETLDEARQNELKIIIPLQFEMTDDEGRSIRVAQGQTSDNECLEAGSSGTKWCKSYLVRLGAFSVRLLDTPGVGSTVHHSPAAIDNHADMLKQDEDIVEDILHFIAAFDHLHAIAIVVKANETRYTDRFNYCLKKLLNNLNRSAIDNLVFIVNFASESNYAVQASLQDRLKVTTSNQNLNKERLFAFDQRCVRYLLAEKSGAYYEDCEKQVFAKAWSKSQESCSRLLKLIVGCDSAPGLAPYKVSDTLSIHEARLFIGFVGPIVNDILSVIRKNEAILSRYLQLHAEAQGHTNALEVKRLLYSIEIRVVELEQPLTVCDSPKCCSVYKAEDGTVTKYHKHVCCDGCLVSGSAWRRRLFCQTFYLASGACKKCECHVDQHRRVYYRTEEINHEDEHEANLLTAMDKEEAIKKLIVFIESRQMKMRTEKVLIESAVDMFRRFLTTNPIFPDTPQDGSALAAQTDVVILPDEVFDIKEQLFKLELSGSHIRQAYDIAKKGAENDSHRQLDETVVFLMNCVQKFRIFGGKALMALKSL